LLDLELSLGQSGKSTVVTIQLTSQMKAGASIKRSGEAKDNTYAPRTDLGVELIESDGNGLADTLRVHLRDGASGYRYEGFAWYA